MASTALLRRRHRLRKSCSQPKLIGQFTQQSCPRMSGDTLASGGHHNVGSARVTLHLGSALLVWVLLASQSTVSFATRAFPRQYGRNFGPFTERSGLEVGDSAVDMEQLLRRAEFLFLAGRDFWDVGIGIDYLIGDLTPIAYPTGFASPWRQGS